MNVYCLWYKLIGRDVLVLINNWMSLSKPHIDHDNDPRTRNNGIYLSIYHLHCVCCMLVPETHVCPEILNVFRYIDVLTCVIYNSTWRTTGATRVCCEDYRWRQVCESCADTWYKWTQLLRQWSCSCPVGNLPTRLWESKTTDELTVLWRSCWQRHNTELTTVPACYFWMLSPAD